MMKPRLFVGSSKEGLEIAYAIQQNLEHEVEVTVWSQGIFELSKSGLDSLIDSLNNFDYGVFVLGPDDIVKIRGKEYQTTRDNVIFELGLFIGKLAKEKNFLIIPRGVENLHLPTDLLGLTPGTFDPNRQDRNLVAALGPACNKIRQAMQKLGSLEGFSKTANVDPQLAEKYDENDYISIIESWMGRRSSNLNQEAIDYSDVDSECKLPSGTAKKYIEVAARRWGYEVERKGAKTILFKFNPLTEFTEDLRRKRF